MTSKQRSRSPIRNGLRGIEWSRDLHDPEMSSLADRNKGGMFLKDSVLYHRDEICGQLRR